jgi:zinc protease
MSRRVVMLAALLVATGLLAPGAGGWACGDEPASFVLDNGLEVVLQRDGSAPITVVQLLVRGGDGDDPPGMPGLAYLTARLSLEVTDGDQLQQLIDMGSSFSLDVGGDYALITIRALSRHLDETLAVLAGMVAEPLFSDLRIGGIKEHMEFLRKLEDDDPVDLMRKTVAASFYDRPACGAARFGTKESLGRLGRRDVQAFHRSRYAGGNMTAFVVSDLAAEELRPLLERRLGRFAAGPRAEPLPLAPAQPASAETTLERKTAQALVSVSTPLPPLSDANFPLAWLLESWLGKGSGSRLWRLRGRGGLAYGLNAELRPHRRGMLLSAYVLSGAGRRAEARAELARLLREAAAEGIGAAELEAAKAFACAEFRRAGETRERRAALLALFEGNGLSWRRAGDFEARLQAIGPDEFNAFLKAALAPERWLQLEVGPAIGTGEEKGRAREEGGRAE